MTRRDIDAAIARLAARQGSAFTRQQAYELGAGPSLVNRRLAARLWLPTEPGHPNGVFVLAGAPPNSDRRHWTAHLAAGLNSIVGFEAAGGLHRFDTFDGDSSRVVIVRHPSHVRVRGATVHQINDVARHHRATLRGLPVTTPARTIVDLAAVLPASRLDEVLEGLVVNRTVPLWRVEKVLLEVARPGKPGVHRLSRLLDARDGKPIPESVLEPILFRAMDEAGVDEFEVQAPVPGWSRGPSRTDALTRDSMVIVEADGRTWHARERAMRRDRERDRAAARAGYQTLRFLGAELLEDPAGVAAAISDVHRTRLRQLRRAA